MAYNIQKAVVIIISPGRGTIVQWNHAGVDILKLVISQILVHLHVIIAA